MTQNERIAALKSKMIESRAIAAVVTIHGPYLATRTHRSYCEASINVTFQPWPEFPDRTFPLHSSFVVRSYSRARAIARRLERVAASAVQS